MKRWRSSQRARHYKKRSRVGDKPSTLQPAVNGPTRSQLMREALNHEDFLTFTFNNSGEQHHDDQL